MNPALRSRASDGSAGASAGPFSLYLGFESDPQGEVHLALVNGACGIEALCGQALVRTMVDPLRRATCRACLASATRFSARR